MSPQRIQRRRTKGWRMPEGAVYVGRGTKWGNPWRVFRDEGSWWIARGPAARLSTLPPSAPRQRWDHEGDAREKAVQRYQLELCCDDPRHGHGLPPLDALEELRGKDLMCFCPLDQPCHADVLLELTDGGAS